MILLDFVLPDMKGDEVCRRLMDDPATAGIPVVYVSGFGTDLQPDRNQIPNVKGSISKPFTSETLIKAVHTYLPESVARPNQASVCCAIERSTDLQRNHLLRMPVEPFSVVERPQVQPPAYAQSIPRPRREER